jgi:hypothetical protein
MKFKQYLEAWYHDESKYKDGKEHHFKDSGKIKPKKEDPVNREIYTVDKAKKVIIVSGDIPANKLEMAKKMNPGFKVQYK